MKELNLIVGQKVWSIQLGYCEVVDVNYGARHRKIGCRNSNGKFGCYTVYGRYCKPDFYQSLFESNPFDKNEIYPEKVEGEWGICSQPESKADLINALVGFLTKKPDCFEMTIPIYEDCTDIAEIKLKKLLESL